MPTIGLDALRDSFLPNGDHVVRLIAAIIFGGLVGLEREIRDKPAGFRTIILICVGACMFTILSEIVGRPDWNSTRIAAQIVTGVGFLGAGAILRDRASVFGMTTAATIWAVAAIGMAVGFGHMALGAAGTVAILIALFLFDVIEKWIGNWRDMQGYHFVVTNADGAFEDVAAMFANAKLKIRKQSCYEDGDALVFHIHAMGSKPHHAELRMRLARSKEYQLRRS